jgi:predicted HTH domain antitoxin
LAKINLACVGCFLRTIPNRQSSSTELAKRAKLRKVRGTHPTLALVFNLEKTSMVMKMNIMMPTITPQGIFDLIKVLPRTDQHWLKEQLSCLLLEEILPHRATSEIIEEVIELYLEDKCSLGRAAELAGVTRWEIMEELSARGVPTNGGHDFSAPEIETMLQVMEKRYGHRDG